MYCENCGGGNGQTETRDENPAWPDVRYIVREITMPVGTMCLCQFCEQLDNPTALFHSQTGEALPLK